MIWNMVTAVVNKIIKRLTIRWALLCFLIIGVIIPVVIFTSFFTNNLNKYLNSIEYDSAQLTIANNVDQLESIIESISYTAAYICNDDNIISYLNTMAASPHSADAVFARENLIKDIRNLSNATMYSLNPDISVITRSGNIIGFEKIDQLEDTANVFNQFNKRVNHAVWHNVFNPRLSGDIEAIWPIWNKNEAIALLHIKVPEKYFWKKMTNHPLLQYKQEVYNGDKLISVINNDLDIPPDKAAVFKSPIKTWNMTLVVTVPNDILKNKVKQQNTYYLSYFLILIFFLYLVIHLISDYMGNPMKILLAQMHKLQNGDFSLSPAPNSFKEINSLSNNLNVVSQRINGLMKEASEQAAMKEKMRFDALMAQINPHFLYNTLNSIKWISTINGNTLAAEMIGRLGKILHYSFGKQDDFVEIKEELQFLEDYVALMQIRYGNNIAYDVQVPEELLSCRILRFCLQPIVENAIMHGNFSYSQGKILVSAERCKNNLILSVIDNGEGMTQEVAENILDKKIENSNSTGIGIWNIQQRINLLFGEKYGLKITSKPNQGCRVDITLPYNYERKDVD